MSKAESFGPYPEVPEVSGDPTREELVELEAYTRQVRIVQGMPLELGEQFVGEGRDAPLVTIRPPADSGE